MHESLQPQADALQPLRALAIAGNVLFILWILYNGINEGFQATPLEKASYFGLMGLLLVNVVLLSVRRRQN